MALLIRMRVIAFIAALTLCTYLCAVNGDILANKPIDIDHTPSTSSAAIETHHSLHKPLDKTQIYWNYGGSTVLTRNSIRLTPATQDRRGWLWNEYPLESKWFEIAVKLDVNSRPHFGGDGLCMWILGGSQDPSFTQRVDALNGPIFGMKDDFNGFGVCIDVYDNDGKRNNPSVFVIAQTPDKPRTFNHDNDFEDDMLTTTPDVLPGISADMARSDKYKSHKCIADIRNQGHPSQLLIKYLHNVLHVYVDSSDPALAAGMTPDYKFCLAVTLDGDYHDHHIAFSAATGGVADVHDIIEVTTRYLADQTRDFDDSQLGTLSKTARSWFASHRLMLFVWFLINLGNIAAAATVGYQLYTYMTMTQNRLDIIHICKAINPYVMMHYGLAIAVTVLLVVGGGYLGLLVMLPVSAFMVYDVYSKQWQYTALTVGPSKGHAVGRVSVRMKLGIPIIIYIIMQIYYFYCIAVLPS